MLSAILLIIAIALFVVAAFGLVSSRVNLVALGLALVTLVYLISVWP